MGTTMKFCLDGSSCNNLLINFSLSPSRPTTSDSSKEVSSRLLAYIGFAPFTIKPSSDFSLYRRSNSVVISSNFLCNLRLKEKFVQQVRMKFLILPMTDPGSWVGS
ncbi:hypothetical protein HanIR_Chr13g0667741 [Helianthus annuus]|nr:hypothetical protein HanIR_Chr13g0667741 [Helianthus annuus]